jgi:hypothetical protein
MRNSEEAACKDDVTGEQGDLRANKFSPKLRKYNAGLAQ